MALWVPQWLFLLRDRNYKFSSPSPGDFELAHTGNEEIAKPRFESRTGVEYKLQENRIQARRLSWFQAPGSGRKFPLA